MTLNTSSLNPISFTFVLLSWVTICQVFSLQPQSKINNQMKMETTNLEISFSFVLYKMSEIFFFFYRGGNLFNGYQYVVEKWKIFAN